MGADKAKKGPGRPQQERTLGDGIKVRFFPEDEELVRRAALKVMKPRGSTNVSAWMREVLIQAAQEVLSEEDG